MSGVEDSDTDKKQAFREVELDLVVAGHSSVADGVVEIALTHPAGEDLPAWTPGAHIDLLLSPSLVRQYSLCGSFRDAKQWTVGVLRDPNSRGGSEFVHTQLSVGSSVRVRGPRNHFPLLTSQRYQFIAGGIGITPMIPMIEAAEARGAEWRLLYCGRQRDSMAFLKDLEGFGDKVTVWPADEHGIPDLPSLLSEPNDDTLIYCCGPEGLLDAAVEACEKWPDGSLQIERFVAKAASAEQVAQELENFEVECARAGVTVTVGHDESIYDALDEAGVDVLVSCLSGVCGTCEVRVVDGTPDHRDSVLTDAEKDENTVMMVCVSRSRTERLVLDI